MITDYTSLQAEIASWTHRGDLASVIPSFVANAEAWLNRRLRTRQQETVFASVALADGAADLPADFLEFKALWVDAAPPQSLKSATSEYVRSRPSDAGVPQYFAIEGGSVICWPTSGNVKGIYYAKIPALATNATNWLLSEAPDLYLCASMAQAYMYMKNGAKAAEYQTQAERMCSEVFSASKAQSIGGGPLTVRVR